MRLGELSVGAGDDVCAIRCLDARGPLGPPTTLADGLSGRGSDAPRASMRWDADAAALLLPPLSLHERARLHLSLGAGVELVAAPGRVTALDPGGRSVLLNLEGQAGDGALRVRVGDAVRSISLRVRARWDESPGALAAMADEVSRARWSAAIRDEAQALTASASLGEGARREAAEERFVLWSLARFEPLRRAIDEVRRAPAPTLSAEVRPVRMNDPRAGDFLAARGLSPSLAAHPERGARARAAALSWNTPENRTLRALLDALQRRAASLDGDDALRRVFQSWRDELPWIELVPLRDEPSPPPRRPRDQVIARCAERLERAAPVLSEGDSRVSPWNTAALYERWCALEIGRALGLSDEHGARLMTGGAVTVAWRGGALVVEAQRAALTPMPLALRPDFTLRVGERRVHLDAKYRLDPAMPEGGLVREELVKMHAYRDAIPGSVGAYALFPGGEGDRLEGRDARGGVGALPLRAGVDEGRRSAQREALRGVLADLLG